jgi:D-serine deaminase-like pyridoxal phosphate-dependent protein
MSVGEQTSSDVALSSDPYRRYEAAFGSLDAPFAFVDLDAMWSNADELLRRAAGKPVRVASKSVRCRSLLRQVLDSGPGFRGLMTFTLRESLWLAETGFEDLLLAYPTTDLAALAELVRLDPERQPVLVIDSESHLDLIDAAAPRAERGAPVKTCIEVDLGYHLARGRVRIGPKRSPIRTRQAVAALARSVATRPGFELAGLMAYEGHIAGLGDRPRGRRLRGAAIRAMQRTSAREIRKRRAEVVDAVRQIAPLGFVNGGGTGSLHTTAAEPAVTEVTAGSGLFAPGLFDDYSAFSLRPAAMFALPVARRPGRGVVTALGGGYLASGAADRDRLPRPHLPAGLSLDPLEGAGEVQTPLCGPAADDLAVGNRVYLRHAKSGELCERFDSLYLLAGGSVVDEVPTYRGEGKAFL